MNFYCINTSKRNPTIFRLLAEACRHVGATCIEIKSELFDYTESTNSYDDSIVYRVASSRSANSVELFLLARAKRVTTFHAAMGDPLIVPRRYDGREMLMQLHAAGFPVVSTIFGIPRDKQLLQRAVDYLEGFPVVLRRIDEERQNGQGVVRIDSFPSLFSIVDYVTREGTDNVLQQYIHTGATPHSLRSIVLGNKIIFTYKISSSDQHEFRSNARLLDRSKPKTYERITLSRTEEQTLVQAAQTLGFELAAIDFAFDEHKKLWIFEVNFPFNFKKIPLRFNVPVHEYIVDYLVAKHAAATPRGHADK
ncbi:MAG: hypothetical protein UY09_C0017G0020 [Parcubacteria group bacterium GW2011_GWA2_47_8]|nr:MAG: hypothetical protein UY09_C0017G0020 [Parcubacteria group bacterium GW2011_GWA2_47_8]